MVTGTFPASSTEYPRVASFLFRSATRIALGPMSTPRRPAPRSRGTPMMLMVLADILTLELQKMKPVLRPEAVEHPWKRDGLTNVFQATDPGHGPFNPHAKARVWKGPILPQVQVPIKRFRRKLVLLDPLSEQLETGSALTASDDLTVAFRSQNINAKGQLGSICIRLHVKSLYLGRIAVNQDRAIILLGKKSFVSTAEITAPLDIRAAGFQRLNRFVVRDPRERRLDSLQLGDISLQDF